MNKRFCLLLFLMFFFQQLILVLFLNNGNLVYSLDDPYIHLALSEGIFNGTYGLNPGEVSSPSSSVLWPFLLVPFVGTTLHHWIPLILNFVFAMGSLLTIWKITEKIIIENYLREALTIALAFSFNLFGLIWTGMEHSLQVFLVLILVLGLLEFVENHKISWWWITTIIISPLVRYEMLAPCFSILLFLFLNKKFKVMLLTLIALLLPISIFSLFLMSQGLHWLPNSVIHKMGAYDHQMSWEFIGNKLQRSLMILIETRTPMAVIIFLMGAFLLGFAIVNKKYRKLALSVFLVVPLQFAFGNWGGYNRYEIYVIAFILPIILFLIKDPLKKFFQQFSHTKGVIILALATFALFPKYMIGQLLTPLATNNIYLQQYQMHRLANFVKAPVAVNDLGYVAYRNQNYVLDLTSLGSQQIIGLRKRYGKDWMGRLGADYGVKLAMIYLPMFHRDIPKEWKKVGELHLDTIRISTAYTPVTIYAIGDEENIRNILKRMQREIPRGAKLKIL